MNFVKKDYLYSLVEQKNLSSVSIYGSDGKTLMLEMDGEQHTPTEVVNYISDFLENQALEGVYVVKLRNKSKKEKSEGGQWKEFGFRIQVGKQSSAINGTVGGAAQSFTTEHKALIEKNLELQTKLIRLEEEAKRKEEIGALQKQIDKLKEESPLDKYAPILMNIFGNKGAETAAAQNLAAVAGTPQENADKIKAAIKRIMKVDANFSDTITKLADFAEKDPDKYKSFIPLLNTL